MLPRLRQRRLKPNWWTITPIVTSAVLWAAILYVSLWTGSAMDNRAEPVAAIAHSEEAVSGR